jgi:hypothetical protein
VAASRLPLPHAGAGGQYASFSQGGVGGGGAGVTPPSGGGAPSSGVRLASGGVGRLAACLAAPSAATGCHMAATHINLFAPPPCTAHSSLCVGGRSRRTRPWRARGCCCCRWWSTRWRRNRLVLQVRRRRPLGARLSKQGVWVGRGAWFVWFTHHKRLLGPYGHHLSTAADTPYAARLAACPGCRRWRQQLWLRRWCRRRCLLQMWPARPLCQRVPECSSAWQWWRQLRRGRCQQLRPRGRGRRRLLQMRPTGPLCQRVPFTARWAALCGVLC